MELTEVGRCVQVGATLVPAMNIQVKDVPGYLYFEDGTNAWYGVYFEVAFEDGSLWIVTQGSEEGDTNGGVIVAEYPKWAMTQSLNDPGVVFYLKTWEEFLGLYDEKRRLRGGTITLST